MLLSAVGLFSLTSYAVTRRTPEIGLRIALGAQAAGIRTMVLRDAMWLVVIGIGIGIPVALSGARWVSGMTYQVPLFDSLTVLLALTILLATAFVAAYLPARRASEDGPDTVALRRITIRLYLVTVNCVCLPDRFG